MIQEKEVCLVIGGEGFLGRHLVNLLCERRKTQPGLEIRIFDISKRLEWPSEIKFFQGDICSFDDLSAACQGGVTTIFQTASPLPNSSSKVLHKVNVEGMKTVIEVCKALKVKKLIYTSSCSVVYDGSPIRNMNEETPLVINHIEEYSRTKYLGERLVLEANSHTLKTCSLRVSGLFGPGDRQNLPGFLSSLDKGRSSTAIGTNQNLFDFTYIENAAHAHLLAFEKLDNSPNVAGEAFFITNGTPIPFFNNARKFLTFFGAQDSFYHHLPVALALLIAYIITPFFTLISPFFQISWTLTPFVVYTATTDRYFDISKARKLLGYEPIYSLEEGVRKSAFYFLEERKKQSAEQARTTPLS